MREQADPTRAFEILYGSVMKRVLGLVADLVGRLTGSPADAESTRLKALTLVGQVLVFRTARAAMLRQMGWSAVGPRSEERRVGKGGVRTCRSRLSPAH